MIIGKSMLPVVSGGGGGGGGGSGGGGGDSRKSCRQVCIHIVVST